MGNPSVEERKAQARRIRDRQNWLILWFIVIAEIPCVAAALQGTFPGVKPKYVFVAGVLVGTVVAQLVHAYQMKGMHPRCPNCGAEWRIIETGPTDNRQHFEEGGTCPHCGMSL